MTNTLRAGLLALSLAGLVIHSPAFAEDANRAARYYEDGLERFNKGDVDGAVVQLKNALQQSPDMLQAHVLLGRSLLEQLELPAAEASFDKALALGVSPREIAVYRARLYLSLGRSKAVLQEITADGLPTRARVEVLTARARAHAMEGDGQAAAAGFDAAMAADPQSVLPYLDLIPFLLESGRVEVADARLADLARLAPNDARTWNLRASISHLRGQLTQALAEYDKAVELEADYVDARIARASIRVDLKRFDEAGADLAYVKAQDAREPRALYLEAVIAAANGDSSAARAGLEGVVSLIDTLPPEYVQASEQLLMLASLSSQGLGDLQRAKTYLGVLTSRFSRNVAARKLLAGVYLAERDSARALSTIEPVLNARPNDPQALMVAGRAYLADGRYLVATELLDRAASLMEGDAGAQAALGFSLLGQGETSKGLESLERAFDSDPSSTGVGIAIAFSYMRQGRTDEALKVARTMVDRDPGNPALLNVLGAVHAAAGQLDQARTAYQSVLRSAPDFAPAALNLARVEAQDGQFDAATRILDGLRAKRKDDARVLYELGRVQRLRGDLEGAAQWLSKTVAVSAGNGRAQVELIETLLEARRTADALAAAKEAMLHHPERLDVLAAFARANLAADKPAEARMAYKAMTRVAEFDPAAQVRIGHLLLASGFAEDAEYNAQKALASQPDFRPARTLQISVAIARGRLKEARAELDRLAAASPRDPELIRLEANLAGASGNVAASVAAYQRAYALAPAPDLALALARVQFQADRRPDAVATLKRELARAESAAVRRGMAEILMRSGQWQAARSELEHLRRLEPRNPDDLNALAIVLMELEDPAAVETAQAALALAPQDPFVIDTAGWVRLRTGDADGALALLREARLRAPGNREIRFHLAVALHQTGRSAEARDELQVALDDGAWFAGIDQARQLLDTIGR